MGCSRFNVIKDDARARVANAGADIPVIAVMMLPGLMMFAWGRSTERSMPSCSGRRQERIAMPSRMNHPCRRRRLHVDPLEDDGHVRRKFCREIMEKMWLYGDDIVDVIGEGIVPLPGRGVTMHRGVVVNELKILCATEYVPLRVVEELWARIVGQAVADEERRFRVDG